MIEMDWLSDECLTALEQIVGGKVYSVYFDPLRYKYDVGFEKDNRLQQEEVTADRVKEALRKV